MEGIILVGFMGSGKTTVSQVLGKELKKPVIDLDQMIEADSGYPIEIIFEKFGEEGFRQMEGAALKKALETDSVIATGGGIILSAEARELLKAHPRVVFLETDADLLVERIRNDQKNSRPLADASPKDEIKQRYFARLAFYEAVASQIVETSHRTPAEIAAEIIEKVGN